MASVTVKYLGSYSALARKRNERVTIDGEESIESLLKRLGQRHGWKLAKSLSSETTAFLVNGAAAERNTVLHHGDELIIATPVGGG